MTEILYFASLPFDILELIFSYFTKEELYNLLGVLVNVKAFSRLFQSNPFWLKLWRRDISSFLPLPDNPYQKIAEIFETVNNFRIEDRYWKIAYLAGNGYDVLLYPQLIWDSDDNTSIVHAATGGYIKIVEHMLTKNPWNRDEPMVNAIRAGHTNIVELMLVQPGRRDWYWALSEAKRCGNFEIINLIEEYKNGN